MADTSVTAVDIFCGAAGLSFGLKASGVTIAGGIDFDPACRYPFEQNINAPFILADIAVVSSATVAAMFGDAKTRLLAGCAPCQPFSRYTALRRDTDNRWQLLLEFLRLVEEIRPELITMENVPQLQHLPLWADFVKRIRAAGYYIDWSVVNAAQYGVPQTRNRLVLIGSLLGQIQLPQPSNGSVKTARTAIGGQPPLAAGGSNSKDPMHSARALTKKNLERIRCSKPAGTNRDWPDDIRLTCHQKHNVRYPSVYGRMSWDRAAPTMTTQFYGFGNGRFGHPEQDRAITLREGALIQSFPLDYKFTPHGQRINFRVLGRLIGNAVPPELAKSIGKAILDHVGKTSR